MINELFVCVSVLFCFVLFYFINLFNREDEVAMG